MYMSKAGPNAPWMEANLNRPLSCQTASKYQSNPAQLYFYMNATALNDVNQCTAWSASDVTMDSRSNDEIKGWLGITWAIIGIGCLYGPKSVGPFTAVTTPLKWIFLFACMGLYVNLNNQFPQANGA
jgi:hypothetical protein